MRDIELIQENITDYVENYANDILKDLNFYQKDEGYKFKAVATFQREFKLKSGDWYSMIGLALKDARNLVQSGQYFPKGMLLHYIQIDEDFVQKEFQKLIVGKENVVWRINNFIDNFKKRFPPSGRYGQSYFDYRFLSFFLAAHQPSKYFYVKSSDYRKFAKQISYNLNLSSKTPGDKYQELAELAKITKEVLISNKRFLDVHSRVISKFDFKDLDFNWGTYDFIFNVSRERWQEKRKMQERRAKINADFNEYYRDTGTYEERLENQISGKSVEELMNEGRAFEPPSASYAKKNGDYKVRIESAKQKRIVKELNGYCCQICGFSFVYKDSMGRQKKYAQVDHMIDKTDGGTEELNNLWVLCPNCHAQKTLGVIIVDKNKKQILRESKKIIIRPGHLKEFGWE